MPKVSDDENKISDEQADSLAENVIELVFHFLFQGTVKTLSHKLQNDTL